MLVLTRKQGEQITIGTDIVVTVTRIEGNRVRISIDAPDDVSVDRKEVFARKLLEATA